MDKSSKSSSTGIVSDHDKPVETTSHRQCDCKQTICPAVKPRNGKRNVQAAPLGGVSNQTELIFIPKQSWSRHQNVTICCIFSLCLSNQCSCNTSCSFYCVFIYTIYTTACDNIHRIAILTNSKITCK